MSKSKKKPATGRNQAAKPATTTAKTAKASAASSKVAATSKTTAQAVASHKPAVRGRGRLAAIVANWLDDQRLNKWLAIVFGLQALALVLFSANRMYPVVVQFVGVDSLASQGGNTVYAAASRVLFSVSLAQILGMALAVSAAFHALAYYVPQVYENAVQSRQNVLRWLENAFSASLLPVAIGLVVGLHDIAAIAMLFILGFTVHIFGWQLEHARAENDGVGVRRSFTMMAICAVVAWAGLGAYVLGTALFGNGLPLLVYTSYLVTLAGVAVYGWVVWQYANKRGRWNQYALTNRVCVLLGFVIKSALVWQLFAGVLRP